MNNILTLTDGYKLDHRRQYPSKTNLIYSNWTARNSRKPNINKIVFFGLQYFIKKYLIEEFNNNFFNQDKGKVLNQYLRRINNYLGPNQIGIQHLSELHDLGYLPLEIKALPEGSLVNLKVPMLTVKNTHPNFFWLTNYIETMMSSTIWFPCTSATLIFEMRKLLNSFANKTSDNESFVDFQGHDFSMRGMTSIESGMLSGAAHLLSFKGTDTLSAIDFLEEYYNADSDKEMIGVSVPATEHSVMSLNGKENEIDTFKRFFTEIYPEGIVSIVSDTWDLWKVIDEFLPKLKNDILKRNGKVVIRPDSGNPVDILTGYSTYEQINFEENDTNLTVEQFSLFSSNLVVKKDQDYYFEGKKLSLSEYKGVIESLYEIFGGVENSKGYKELDSHIGVIYGDGITFDKAQSILERLQIKGFASTNVVFGIGSYFYQCNTRDTFYFAMKTTYGEIDNKGYEVFKKPVTDDGKKHSATGLLKVIKEGGDFILIDKVTKEEELEGELKTVFIDSKLIKETSLKEIRENISNDL